MTQGGPSSSELSHYGVKGMKWGVRRAEKKAALDAPSKRYSKQSRAIDERNHGQRAVKRINRRLNKGKTLKKARAAEIRRDTYQTMAVMGAVMAGRLLVEVGPVLSQKTALRAERKRGEAAVAEAMGLPRTATSGPNYSRQNRKGVYNISSL